MITLVAVCCCCCGGFIISNLAANMQRICGRCLPRGVCVICALRIRNFCTSVLLGLELVAEMQEDVVVQPQSMLAIVLSLSLYLSFSASLPLSFSPLLCAACSACSLPYFALILMQSNEFAWQHARYEVLGLCHALHSPPLPTSHLPQPAAAAALGGPHSYRSICAASDYETFTFHICFI